MDISIMVKRVAAGVLVRLTCLAVFSFVGGGTAAFGQVIDPSGNSLFQDGFATGGAKFILGIPSPIVELPTALNAKGGRQGKIRYATTLQLLLTNGVSASSGAIVMPNTPDTALTAKNLTRAALTISESGNKQRVIGSLANAMLVGELLEGIDAARMQNRLGALIRLLPNEPEAIQAAVGSLAAEAHASAKPALLSASAGLKDAVSAQMGTAFGAPRSQSTGDSRFSLGSRKWHHGGSADDQPVMWAKVLASWGDHDGNDLYQNTEYEVAGALLGGDAIASAISSDFRLGFFTGLAKLKFTQESNNVEGDDDSRNAGIYGGMKISNFLLRSGVTYVWHDITTSRTAFNGAIAIRAAYNARTLGAFGEAAFRFETDQALFEPFMGVNYSQHLSDAYEENAGGTVMPVDESKTHMGVLELGMRATREIPQLLPGATGKLMFSVNVPLKDPEVTVRQAIGNSRHVDIRGIPASGRGINLEAGLDFRMRENMQVDMSYAYSRSTYENAQNRHSFQGRFTYSF